MTPPHVRGPRHGGTAAGRPLDLASEMSLLLVSLATMVGVTRLVTPSGTARLLVPVVLVTVAGHAMTAIGYRAGWRAWASLVAAATAAVLTVIWAALPGTTWWGVPSAGTVSHLVDGLRTAASTAAVTSSPVRLHGGIVLLVALGSGVVAAVGRRLLTTWGATARRETAWGDTARRETTWGDTSRWETARHEVTRGETARGAVAGRRRRGRPLLPVLVPSFAVFCYASVLSADRARMPAAVAYVVTAVTFLFVAGRHDRRPTTRGPGVPGGTGRFGVGAMAAVTVAGALVTLQLPGVADLTLSAFVAHKGSGLNGPVTTLDLEAKIGAVRATGSHAVMFRAQVDRPTYWQVTTLVDDEGGNWLPSPAAARASGQGAVGAGVSPPVLPYPPSSGQPVQGEVELVGLRTALLPVPSTEGWVQPAHGVPPRLVRGVGAQLTTGPASVGYRYRFALAVPQRAGPGIDGVAGGPLPAATWSSLSVGGTRPYLQLPTEPGAVVRLARRLAPTGATPLATALAIKSYLTSGRFAYTPDPPPTPPGRSPLTEFLFDSHLGFCQQFATAFATLARLDHLPTRLAVGFTPGTADGSGAVDTYTVTAADAHVWPQVYLGPANGWVDFEPTPGDGSGTGTRPGPVAPTTASPTGIAPATSTPVSTGRSRSSSAGGSSPGSSRATGGHRAPTSALTPSDLLRLPVAGGLAALALLGALVVGLVVRSRRRRRGAPSRRRAGGPHLGALRARWRARRHGRAGAARRGPAAVVGACWAQAEQRLERAGLQREPFETMHEHARRCTAVLADEAPAAASAYARLVELAESAAYGPGRLGPAEAEDAFRLLATVRALPARRRPEDLLTSARR